MIYIIAFLLICLLISIFSNILLIKDIRLLTKEVEEIKVLKTHTNKKLSTITHEKNICILINSMNDILEIHNQIMIKSERENKNFRQAITNISHDLRTPLTSSLGYVQLIKSHKTIADKKEEYIIIVEERLKALSNIMNNLFEYAQIEEGINKLDFSSIDIAELLTEIISSYYNDFTLKNINIDIHIPNEPMYIFCDEKSMTRIIKNLVHNALIHGENTFIVKLDKTNKTILVSNNIPQNNLIDIDCLFERFYTSDLSRVNKSTGLGLAIAKKLIELNNFKITAEKFDNSIQFIIKLE